MSIIREKSFELAAIAIQRVVTVFCERCAVASDALATEEWERFDEYFQLQHIAWLNLNALVAKFESDFTGRDSSDIASSISAWLRPCACAAESLRAQIADKAQSVEAEGRSAGRLRRHLAAFKGSEPSPVQFRKGA